MSAIPFGAYPREMDSPTLPPSLWAATAEPAAECPPLESDARADVVIVGGGYAGLSAALHLAEQGIAAVLLEAAEPGWGASGRNGGQVIPGLKHDPDVLEQMLGHERGARLVAAVGSAPDLVFDLIARHGIRCDAVREGWIQPAHCEAALSTLLARAAQWAERGAPVETLDRDRVASLIGTTVFHGGWLDRRGGGLHPLSYARGLARAAIAAGARIHGATRARSLQRAAGRWRVATERGTVEADRVVLATNAYTDGLWPGLARTVVPVYSFMVATQPLAAHVRERILPGRQVASDSRRLLNYFMVDRDGRLLIGGRGPFVDRPAASAARPLKDAIRRLFPDAADTPLAYRWAGRVAMTADHLPHVHAPAPGVFVGLGFNGRGVAMATLAGRELAHLASGRARDEVALPVTAMRPLAFHMFHRPVVRALIRYYRTRDLLEQRTAP